MKSNREVIFICYSCQLEWGYEFLGIKNSQGEEYCFDCWNNKPEQAENNNFQLKPFICEFCSKNKAEKPIYAHVKNMPDKRNSKEISQICSYCSYARAKKENFYCPRFSSGRDSWDPNVPEFDCFCERKKY